MLQVRIPVGRVGVETPVEALANALVRLVLAASAVDFEQLQVGQRADAAVAADMAHQQVDGGFVLAEHDEELGLLFEVNQFLDRQFTHRFGSHRDGQRHGRRARRPRRDRRGPLADADAGADVGDAEGGAGFGRVVLQLRSRRRRVGRSACRVRSARCTGPCGLRRRPPLHGIPAARLSPPKRRHRQHQQAREPGQPVDQRIRIALGFGFFQPRLHAGEGFVGRRRIAAQARQPLFENDDALPLAGQRQGLLIGRQSGRQRHGNRPGIGGCRSRTGNECGRGFELQSRPARRHARRDGRAGHKARCSRLARALFLARGHPMRRRARTVRACVRARAGAPASHGSARRLALRDRWRGSGTARRCGLHDRQQRRELRVGSLRCKDGRVCAPARLGEVDGRWVDEGNEAARHLGVAAKRDGNRQHRLVDQGCGGDANAALTHIGAAFERDPNLAGLKSVVAGKYLGRDALTRQRLVSIEVQHGREIQGLTELCSVDDPAKSQRVRARGCERSSDGDQGRNGARVHRAGEGSAGGRKAGAL